MIIQIGTDVDESRILWKHKESDEWERADVDDLIEAYEGIPKGKWVEDGYYDYPYYVCSNCGQGCWVQNNGVEIEPLRTKYCPNCGARMEEEEKEK